MYFFSAGKLNKPAGVSNSNVFKGLANHSRLKASVCYTMKKLVILLYSLILIIIEGHMRTKKYLFETPEE
jgi:hypothetical protein